MPPVNGHRSLGPGLGSRRIPWYVPEDALFDYDPPEYRTGTAAAMRRIRHASDRRSDPWCSDVLARTAEDFDLIDNEPDANWDEAEEWDDLIPMRPTLRPNAAEFEDLVGLYGVNFDWTEWDVVA